MFEEMRMSGKKDWVGGLVKEDLPLSVQRKLKQKSQTLEIKNKRQEKQKSHISDSTDNR